MLFNTLSFLLFFPAVCCLYFAIPAGRTGLRTGLLLAASYYFYMSWEPGYALLLLLCTAATYVSALGMERSRSRRGRRRWLGVSIAVNLSALFLFKYYDFAARSLTALLHAGGLGAGLPGFRLLLPVGISFYTFQALGYSVDVYRGTTRAERHFWTYALFVSFFPQLVAGPIERSAHLLPQFRERHRFCAARAMSGLRLMAWGYFMKLAVADRCGLFVDAVFDHAGLYNGGTVLAAAGLFPFQLYGDFGGYSLIAIGTARVLGFRLMDNFRRPYLACSVGDFWRRWHISLSTWFKDYVYIPLGGNRCRLSRQLLNLMLTFTVSGLWHGADWTFLCWGCLHGLLLCAERLLGIGRRPCTGWRRVGGWAATFGLVSLGLVLFRADSLTTALQLLSAVFTRPGLPDISFAMFTELCASAGAIAVLMLKETAEEFGRPARLPLRPLLRPALTVTTAAAVLLFGVLGGDQFIYFQF